MNIRFYAREKLADIFDDTIRKYISKYNINLKILPTVFLDYDYTFESCESSDFSIMIVRDELTDRETQSEQLIRHVSDVVDKTKNKTLILIFCYFDEEKTSKYKIEYENAIPNVKVEFFDITLYPNSEDLEQLENCISKFVITVI